MEVIVATVIATVAVLGLAYSFGMGRSYINRFEKARMALAAAESQMEALAVLPTGSADLTYGAHAGAFSVDGVTQGTLQWTISPYDDPADGLGGADPQPADLKHVVLEVTWVAGALADTIQLERYLPAL